METQIVVSSIPIIRVEGLSRQYSTKGSVIKALNNVSFDVNEGEFVAIMGESGSGKSTLLQIIGGLEKPNSGSVNIDGIDITKLSANKRAAFRKKFVGYIFQFFYLQSFLTLRQNIELPLLFTSLGQSEPDKGYITELIRHLKLSERIDHLPKELSGGQIQRVAIARALVNKPRVLLADEPTGNLDEGTSRRTIDLFNDLRLKFKTTIIVVTHDKDIASRADRVITLKDGTLI